MRLVLKRLVWVIVLLAAAGLLIYAFIPAPVEVDVAEASRGRIEVSVDEEGRTRVRDRYVISAPLAGRLLRVDLKAGDSVAAGETVLAVIEPLDTELLDARRLAEAEARVEMAQAALERAGTLRERSAAELAWAEGERYRVQRLQERAAVTRKELDDAVLQETVRRREHEAAYWSEQVAGHELELAQAALQFQQAAEEGEGASMRQLALRSPLDGQVLRVIQESEAPVQPGTPLLEIGYIGDLEVVMDVLSREAVRISPGDRVRFVRWGGERPLEGVVRRVEPSAFTKVSALGVEEQRVNVIADLVGPPGDHRLGDGFRVDARIIVDERPDALKVPVGALFRHGDGWAVFVIVDDVARLRPVRIGVRGSLEAEVLEGLQDNDLVIVYPSDQVRHGVSAAPR